MIRYNYSTTILTHFFKGPVSESFLQEKTSIECTFIPNKFPRNYLNKTVKTVILLTTAEINIAPRTVLIQTTFIDQTHSCITFKFTLLGHHQTMEIYTKTEPAVSENS